MNKLEKEEIKKLFNNEIVEMGFELVDIELNITNIATNVKLFVDKEGGITIDECTDINRSISDLIFRKDLFPKNCQLEVSSPGLDRPLKTKRDFERNSGRNIILEYRDELDLKIIEGKIVSAGNELIIISDGDESVSISFENIDKGKIKLPW